jgi:hypothetical protein
MRCPARESRCGVGGRLTTARVAGPACISITMTFTSARRVAAGRDARRSALAARGGEVSSDVECTRRPLLLGVGSAAMRARHQRAREYGETASTCGFAGSPSCDGPSWPLCCGRSDGGVAGRLVRQALRVAAPSPQRRRYARLNPSAAARHVGRRRAHGAAHVTLLTRRVAACALLGFAPCTQQRMFAPRSCIVVVDSSARARRGSW